MYQNILKSSAQRAGMAHEFLTVTYETDEYLCFAFLQSHMLTILHVHTWTHAHIQNYKLPQTAMEDASEGICS
jgi:hypothetical protein